MISFNNLSMRKILQPLFTIVGIVLGCFLVYNLIPKELGYSSPIRTSYDIIGTADTFTAVTSTYAVNRNTIYTGNLDNLHLDISWTPTTTNEYLLVLLEGSNDEGETFFPLGSKTIDTDEIALNIEDFAGNIGLPIVFPGDKTSATGTIYSAMFDQDLVADHLRISVKSSNTSTPFGSAYVRATVSSQ